MNLATQPIPIIVAKSLASQGFAVFPVCGRRPLTSHGVYSATTDISRFSWASADGCGLATGKVNGVDVLDVDVRQSQVGRESSPDVRGVDGLAVLAALGSLPETLTASTPRRGRHFYFRHIEGSRNCKLGDGSLEWFSDGKLVVVPPAPGREWICETEIATAPEWLKTMVLSPHPHPRHAGQGNSSGPLVTATGSSHVPKPIYMLILRGMRNANARAQRRVRGLWSNLAAKGQHRNDGLNYTAWEYRAFVGSGDLDAEVAANLLWLACEANGYLAKDGEDVVKEVINRVLETGEPNDRG